MTKALKNHVTVAKCLIKVKKKNTANTVYDQSCSTSDPKRSWSIKIDQIENVTVKKTFAGTDQTTWNRVNCDISTGQYQSSAGSDEDWYWPAEISQLNSLSRCSIGPCKSLLDCNVFNLIYFDWSQSFWIRRWHDVE